MIKNISFRNFIVFIGTALAITACFLLFTNQLQYINGDQISNISNNIYYFGGDFKGQILTLNVNATILPFIGYILMGVGGAIGLVSILFSRLARFAKFIRLFAFASCVVGAVFVFISQQLFVTNNYTGELALVISSFKVTFMHTLSGIFGSVGGGLFLLVEYIGK